MAIRQDCPICGRKSNEGRVYIDSESKGAITFETIICGLGGFFFGGPIGAAAGAALANKGMKAMAKERYQGKTLYRFSCQNPDCKHEWTSWVTE